MTTITTIKFEGEDTEAEVWTDMKDEDNYYGFKIKTYKLLSGRRAEKYVVEFTKHDGSEYYMPNIPFDSYLYAEIFVSGFLSCLGMRKKAGF